MTPVIRVRNGVIFVDNTPVQQNAVQETYITAEAASGASTLTVRNIAGFAVNQILLIEELGNENAEIIKTHASSAPSGSTVTLVTTLARTHAVNSKVYIINVDQFELSYATTATGSKTTLTTTLGSGLVAIQADVKVQRFEIATADMARDFFFARYKDSISTDFYSYTDALKNAGWAKNTVGYAMDRALRDLGIALSNIITREDCYAWVTEGLDEMKGKLKRWPGHYLYNKELSTVTTAAADTVSSTSVTVNKALTRGVIRYPLPDDVYDSESNRSILGLRVGTDSNLTYLSPEDFEERLEGVAYGRSSEVGDVGETAITLSDTNASFASSGTVNYYVSGTLYSFTYTGFSSSTFTGIPASGDGSITQAFAIGDYLWQGEAEGTPSVYTVREDGWFEIYPAPNALYHGQAIYIDFATVLTTVNSDGDEIDDLRFDAIQAYLTWRMKMKARNNGTLDLQDGYYLKHKERLNDAIRTQVNPHQPKQQPNINMMRRR